MSIKPSCQVKFYLEAHERPNNPSGLALVENQHLDSEILAGTLYAILKEY